MVREKKKKTEKKKPNNPTVVEREVNLSLLNEKLNYLIGRVEELSSDSEDEEEDEDEE